MLMRKTSDQARARTSASSKSSSKKSTSAIDKHVGARVRMRRMLLTISQEKLGEKLGITFQQIQKYEKGTNRIGAGRLLAIAQALGTTVSYFYEGVEEHGTTPLPEGSANISAFLASRDGLALIKAWQRIESAETRAATLRIVENVATAASEAAGRKLGKN